jgi:hypothetical protein
MTSVAAPRRRRSRQSVRTAPLPPSAIILPTARRGPAHFVVHDRRKSWRSNFHNNAAVLIVAAAERSGLLRDVANALRQSREIPVDEKCLADGVLAELTENFGEECRLPGYDFYGEGFCVTEYEDAELAPYLQIPFELPTEQQHAIAEAAYTASREAFMRNAIATWGPEGVVAQRQEQLNVEKLLAQLDSDSNPKRGTSGWTQGAEESDAS